MLIGVPKEIKNHEYRVGLVPSSVRELVHHGHKVLVETGAAGVTRDPIATTMGTPDANVTFDGAPSLPLAVGSAAVAAAFDRAAATQCALALGNCVGALELLARYTTDRHQFGVPIASFQAVRHRLAETLVAIEGAEATLSLPSSDSPDLTAMLAKAAAGKAALLAAKHCQQVLGGIGFTDEHDLHIHVKRALVLDGLLGSSRELSRKAGAGLRARKSVPRLAEL